MQNETLHVARTPTLGRRLLVVLASLVWLMANGAAQQGGHGKSGSPIGTWMGTEGGKRFYVTFKENGETETLGAHNEVTRATYVVRAMESEPELTVREASGRSSVCSFEVSGNQLRLKPKGPAGDGCIVLERFHGDLARIRAEAEAWEKREPHATMTELRTALMNYYSEYKRFPVAAASGVVCRELDAELVEALLALPDTGGCLRYNRRGISFLNTGKVKGLGTGPRGVQILDPWGRPYVVFLNLDVVFDWNTTYQGKSVRLQGGVVICSLGSNGVFEGNDGDDELSN